MHRCIGMTSNGDYKKNTELLLGVAAKIRALYFTYKHGNAIVLYTINLSKDGWMVTFIIIL